jgi:hypothetical protein
MDILAASGPITLESGTTPFILERSILGAKAGSSVTASSSNITLTSNDLRLGATTATANSVLTTGTLTMQPTANSSFSSAFSIPTTFSYSGITGLTLGRPGNTSGITIANTTSVNGPVWIYGDATINAAVSTTAAGSGIYIRANGDATIAANLSANGPIDVTANNVFVRANLTKTAGSTGIIGLVAKDRIQLDNGRTITSNGSDILLASNSDATNGGSIFIDRSSILSGGGAITLGGGDALGSGYAEGSAGAGPTAYPNHQYRGILLNQATINGGGGNVVLRGRGWQGGNTVTGDQYAIGIDVVGYTGGSTVTTSGAGMITLLGVGGVNHKATTHGVGINFYSGIAGAAGVNSISSGAGAITITGTAGSGSALHFSGINVDAQTVNVLSTQILRTLVSVIHRQ